jgi:hypothetical protein
VPLEPRRLFFQSARAELAGPHAPDFFRGNEPGLLQDADVLHHAREGHLEFLGKFRDRGVGTPELLQNAAPGGIRERGERGIEAGLRTLYHSVKCLTRRLAACKGLRIRRSEGPVPALCSSPPCTAERANSQLLAMTLPAPKLQDLVGQPLWAVGRAANMQWFHFGRRREVVSSLPSRRGQVREVGELALHVQSPWRLRVGGRILVGSYDLNFPRGVCERSGIPDDFDWGMSPNRLDELAEHVRASLLPADVLDVVVGAAGAFTLLLRGDLGLDVFPNASSESEHWRLFVPGDNEREHLIHEAEPCPSPKDGSGEPGPR